MPTQIKTRISDKLRSEFEATAKARGLTLSAQARWAGLADSELDTSQAAETDAEA